IKYQWYAGNVSFSSSGTLTGTPMELGSANLLPSDPLEHPPHAMIGALVVEPQGMIWCNAAKTTCSATMAGATVGNVYDTTADIYKPGVTAPQFREFVTMLQDNVYLSTGNNFMSVNFGVEPFLLPKNVATSRYTGYLSSMPAPCINNGVYE